MTQPIRRPDAGTLGPVQPPTASRRESPVRRARGARRGRPSLAPLAFVLLAFMLLAQSLLPAAARAACLPDPPSDDGSVVCIGTDSTGFDGSGADNLTITTLDEAELDDSDAGLDSAILVEDNSSVEIGDEATVTVTEANGFGIRGDDDNFVENKGTIVLDANDARAISIDENTTGVLPNGAVNSGTIRINGDRGYGLETGENSGVANSGTIEILGDDGRGLSAGNRTDRTKAANITNSGDLVVNGANSFGMKLGDGWLDGTVRDHDDDPSTPNRLVPSAAGIRNQSDIFVVGAGSTGIFAGDESNGAGNHNSLVSHSGTIAVSGTDAVGISVGGNDLFDRFDLESPTGIGAAASLTVSGSITGDADSGPLVEIRNFVLDRENRILNSTSGRIQASLANQGTLDRAIAIRGTDGDELILNAGQIRGNVELRGGDDRFLHGAGATYSGVLSGGNGEDELILTGVRANADTFDLGALEEFETVRLFHGASAANPATPWILTNGDDFTGVLEIEDFATLEIPTPLTLGGDLDVSDGGTIRVTLDSTTPPLTVQGSSTLDGKLEIEQGDNLTPSATPYYVLVAVGGRDGEFDDIEFPDASGTRLFSAGYDATGVFALFQEVGLVGVAQNANQRAVAQNLTDLQAAGGSTDDLQDVVDGLDDIDNLAAVYDALSPEAYDAQTTVSVEAGRRIAALLFDRPRECQAGEVDPWNPNHRVLPCHARRVAPWAATVGSFRKRDEFNGHNRYDAQLGGLIAGVDFQPLAGLDLTLAFSSQRGGIDVARAGESTLTLAELTGAVAWSPGPLRVQGVVSWGHGFHQDRRQIRFDSADSLVNTRGVDDHESDRTLLATEVGYRVSAGPIGVEPLVGFDWAWMSQDGIDEDDAGGFGLDVDDRDDEVGSVRAGVRLSSVYEHKAYLGPWFEWMTGIWRPSFDVAWRQFVEGHERDIDARLQGSPDTVAGFTVQGEEDEGGAEIGVGFRFVPVEANRLRFDLRYQAYVADHTLEQDLVAQVAIAF